MVLAPESEYTALLTTPEQKEAVEAYVSQTSKRTERERIADRKVTGVFTGAYAINPLTLEEIPIWVSDYVLAGYGTGAIMAVPAHDSRDYAFAKTFGLEIRTVVEGADVSEQSFDAKEGIIGAVVSGGKAYRVFSTLHSENVKLYINDKDWSIIELDAAGNAVKYGPKGVKSTRTFIFFCLLSFFAIYSSPCCFNCVIISFLLSLLDASVETLLFDGPHTLAGDF